MRAGMVRRKVIVNLVELVCNEAIVVSKFFLRSIF